MSEVANITPGHRRLGGGAAVSKGPLLEVALTSRPCRGWLVRTPPALWWGHPSGHQGEPGGQPSDVLPSSPSHHGCHPAGTHPWAQAGGCFLPRLTWLQPLLCGDASSEVKPWASLVLEGGKGGLASWAVFRAGFLFFFLYFKILFKIIFFFLFRATPAAYGGSQARG